MSGVAGMAAALRQHLALAEEIRTLVERESQSLRTAENPPAPELLETRKALLARLITSLDEIKQHRADWQKLGPAERAQHPDIAPLLRANQDLIMKTIMLDRENEQTLLRRGMVPPRHLPSANRQRPHYVADLYRRQNQSDNPK